MADRPSENAEDDGVFDEEEDDDDECLVEEEDDAGLFETSNEDEDDDVGNDDGSLAKRKKRKEETNLEQMPRGGGDASEKQAVRALCRRLEPQIAGVPPAATSHTLVPEEGARSFMVLDVIVQRAGGGYGSPSRTEVLLIGRAADGASVCVCARGWQPYLLVQVAHTLRYGSARIL